eukprot:gnl/TRDRNA2_/TRDRNA2_174400_c0_seq12.p1 gnl/TRDRNA2_/TRDRNA2_174400_c0~~gnl/TRDRNA2_/TRDRNA2_174400_c0_seq12.p1  ORF type:complete len:476 (+),score=73.39 gnl/TRDRNA2_/TRDRNA2_174400_c0_seq12:52-1479(+)
MDVKVGKYGQDFHCPGGPGVVMTSVMAMVGGISTRFIFMVLAMHVVSSLGFVAGHPSLRHSALTHASGNFVMTDALPAISAAAERNPPRPASEVAAEFEEACKQEGSFEDALDVLAWDIFVAPLQGFPPPQPPHPNQTNEEKQQKLHGNLTGQRSSSKAEHPAPRAGGHHVTSKLNKAAQDRLASWLEAAERAKAADDKTALTVTSVNGTKVNKTKTGAKVLPPACAWQIPVDDPYWKQKDSYWVWNGHQWVAYNSCRYSNGCKKQYTNAERVTSIRKTLSVTHQFLKKFGVYHALYGGSAIGAYRCKDVLPWDVDSDVMVLNSQFPSLMNLLNGAPQGTGWKHKGRSIDMSSIGFPGFTLMEKYPGCMPLVVVDQSTGFFTDLFPVLPVQQAGTALTPWWDGKVRCDTKSLFNGCHNNRCHQWTLGKTLPPSSCKIHTYEANCPAQLHAWLLEHFGPGVEKPDKETRGGSAAAA